MGGRPIDVANPGVAAPPEGGSLSRGCQQRSRRGNRGLPDPVGDGAGGAALAISSCASNMAARWLRRADRTLPVAAVRARLELGEDAALLRYQRQAGLASWAGCPRARRHRARCAHPRLCATMAELRFQARGFAGIVDTEQDDDFAATHGEICLSEGQVFPVAHRQPCTRKQALPRPRAVRASAARRSQHSFSTRASRISGCSGRWVNPECRESPIVAMPWSTPPDLAELPPALAARGLLPRLGNRPVRF
jgi:hypothetical protein